MARLYQTSIDLNNVSKIINLPTPTGAADAVNKAYVDAAIEGTAWKDSVRVASTANVTVSGPGASIDSITLAQDDRVLLKDQTDASQNGIYIFNGSASAMTRAPFADTADELEQAVVSVEEGTSASSTFRQTAVNFTLDTDDITFASFGTAAPVSSETQSGTIEIATQVETDAGTDDVRAITPLKLKNSSLLMNQAEATIGDGSAVSFNIDHNFGTRNVSVTVFGNSGDYEDIIPDVQRPSANRVTLVFASAPASNAYNVVIQGK